MQRKSTPHVTLKLLKVESDNRIVLKTENSEFEYANLCEFQSKLWKVAGRPEEATELKDWESMGPMTSFDFTVQAIKGALFKAMYQEDYKHNKSYSGDKLKIVLLGNKKEVHANQDFPKNSLVLVPVTNSIAIKQIKQNCDDKSSGVALGFAAAVGGSKDCTFYLNPWWQGSAKESPKDDKVRVIVPFWAVSQTENRSEANMIVQDCSNWDILNQSGQINVVIPLMRNSKELSKGEVLKVFVAPKQQDKTPVKDKRTPDGNSSSKVQAAKRRKS